MSAATFLTRLFVALGCSQGLSYTSFRLGCAWQGVAGSLPGSASCTVTNTGNLAGDEVVMVFHSAGTAVRAAANHPVPIKALIDFQRVSVEAGGMAGATFELETHSVELIDEAGLPRIYKGQHGFEFSRGHGKVVTYNVTV